MPPTILNTSNEIDLSTVGFSGKDPSETLKDASICKSHWEKSSTYPAGEYEYIDVIFEGGDRVLIDLDFRSEFKIARPTGSYNSILQSLPYIFVGEAVRLQQILSIVTKAAKHILKKKGMHVATNFSKHLVQNFSSPPLFESHI
ncbi:hypothetical protein L1987_01811 [Smallanthus sonchifolius]|uniref:Uncharacterized protein n=1 Tax=Smallanthus sonchifolius TaxID=185202 RepID=A0ACB9K655_9ASTR|nr:hypothetical protein L1987_01811 [Smallanthus sonchifolius]